ncbi:ergothioneine biosynthesis protein EgtC [Nocardia sp. CDC159]|uniref:Gamma-glutamyl-hercynylcysteine sulfoxide hydrolase n=1 Tax=Nocardia pulmonis TaxID=2951408 RepID=A0A9X2EBC5_9NOCA|nr:MULTISPECIES: ergothioneine biosynthesis protein EgtC [Nocardia]MCM6777186.1 ergothioneine biosynthesis protein EgtC [Nocardia pulmonis]MCM6790071.1 ergothioneine biosynthesis protein EgtC [Nocardia sp. CDC159]
MCRHLGYLGAPIPVGALLTRGPHSLRTQAWAPRDMRGGGTINADGFGVAWWIPAAAASPETGNVGTRAHGGPTDARGSGGGADAIAASEPLVVSRYRNAAPIWTDPAVDEVLPQLRSPAVLAAVRSATVGMPVERTACAPFAHGRWAFSHNGAIPDWQRVLTAVATEFDSPSLLEAESRTDSAALWVVLRHLLERDDDRGRPGIGIAEPKAHALVTGGSSRATDPAVARAGGDDGRVTGGRNGATPAADSDRPESMLRQVALAVLRHSPTARLNLLLGDGETLWATTVHHALSALVTDEVAILASEPYDDDPRWRAIPDRRLVTARPGELSVASLELEQSERARS